MSKSLIPLSTKSLDPIDQPDLVDQPVPDSAAVKSAPFTLSTRGFSELNKIIRLVNAFNETDRADITLITGCALTAASLIKQTVILKQDTRFIARIFPNGHIEWQAYTDDVSEQFKPIIAESIAEHFAEIINPKPTIKIDDTSLESAMNELFRF